MHGSITKEREQGWKIVYNPELIIKVQAYSHGTYLIAEKGTICDAAQNRQNMSVLSRLVIAQSIEQENCFFNNDRIVQLSCFNF